MDLIFNRYSSPFVIMEQMIECNRFNDFMSELWANYNDEVLLKVYLSNNPYNTIGFEEWKQSLEKPTNTKSLETTVNDSYSILNNFNPNDGG